MQLTEERIKELIENNKELFKLLENPTHNRKKIYLTLSQETINKLNQLRQETHKPISRIIEEKFSDNNFKGW
jgi:predicted ribosome quality control (RQC) complex YloA/Tae2 family protein